MCLELFSHHIKRPKVNGHITQTSSKLKYITNDPNQKKITDALVPFIAGTLILPSVVENPEFKLLIESLNPRNQSKSRKQFSTKVFLERLTKIQTSLKDKLRAVERTCLTVDLWSNRQMKGSLGSQVTSYWNGLWNRSWCHASGTDVNIELKTHDKNMKKQKPATV